MKIVPVIYVSLAVATFIIGVHQTFVFGVKHAYWLFMLTAAALILARLRRNHGEEPTPPPADQRKRSGGSRQKQFRKRK